MAYLGIFMVLYALWITPLHLRMDVAAGQHISGALVLHAWNMRFQANLGLVRDDKGKLHLAFKWKGSQRQHGGSVEEAWRWVQALVRTVRRTNVTRAFILKTISVLDVGLKMRIGFADASYTALCAGMAGIVLDILRNQLKMRQIPCTLSAWPDFTGKPCATQLSCILFMRLGNLLVGCALAGFAVLLEHKRVRRISRKEENAWNTPSET